MVMHEKTEQTHPKVITQERSHVLGTVKKRRLYLKHFPDN